MCRKNFWFWFFRWSRSFILNIHKYPWDSISSKYPKALLLISSSQVFFLLSIYHRLPYTPDVWKDWRVLRVVFSKRRQLYSWSYYGSVFFNYFFFFKHFENCSWSVGRWKITENEIEISREYLTELIFYFAHLPTKTRGQMKIAQSRRDFAPTNGMSSGPDRGSNIS